MNILGFRFSPGNSKLGKIWNFSLPPVKACPKGVPCAVSNGCYAHKAYRMYPGVRKAWNENLLTLKQHGYAELGHAVNRFLDKTKVKYFRVHVAGDFIDQKHLVTWVQIAYTHPETKFLAFTKNMMLDYRCLPKNLIIRRSEWPNWYPLQTLSCMMLPRARVSDGPFYAEGSNKKGADEYWCPGSCTNCKVCWEQPKRNIVFEKH